MKPEPAPLNLSFAPMTRAAAAEVVGWRYAPPYDVYNFDPATQDADIRYLIDPAHRIYAISTPSGELVAFCSLGADAQVPGGAYDVAALDLGLGLRPDLTGRGQGLAYVGAVVAFARRQADRSARREAAAGQGSGSAPPALRVTIAAFNHRARRVWARAGFRQVAAFRRPRDGMRFVVMVARLPFP